MPDLPDSSMRKTALRRWSPAQTAAAATAVTGLGAVALLRFAVPLNHTGSCSSRPATFAGLAGTLPFDAALGIAFFVSVLAVTLCKSMSRAAEWGGAMLAGASIGALAFTTISLRTFVRLPSHAGCWLCWISWACSLGLFLSAIVDIPEHPSLPKVCAGGAVGLLLTVLAGVSAAALGPHSSPDPRLPSDRRLLELWLERQERLRIVAQTHAPVALVVYTDYQCVFCKRAFDQLETAFPITRPEVALEFRDYPLNSTCNAHVSAPIHPFACEAAVAARLAARTDSAAALRKWLFDHQHELSRASISGALAGIARVEFATDYAATMAAVRGDAEYGYAVGVRGTPTVFMNGVRLPNGLTTEVLSTLIDIEATRVEGSAQ